MFRARDDTEPEITGPPTRPGATAPIRLLSPVDVPEDDAPEDDGAIVAQARDDLRLFAPLYDRYHDAVFGFCLRRTLDREAAADATQQTFARAMTRLADWQGGSFPAWLFAVARSVVVDGVRRERPTVVLDPARAEARPDREPPPDEQVIRAERQHRLLAAMANLTAVQRAVVELRLAGLSGPEIASALGMTPGAAQSCQYRAYRALRRRLADDPLFGDTP